MKADSNVTLIQMLPSFSLIKELVSACNCPYKPRASPDVLFFPFPRQFQIQLMHHKFSFGLGLYYFAINSLYTLHQKSQLLTQ